MLIIVSQCKQSGGPKLLNVVLLTNTLTNQTQKWLAKTP